MNFNKKKNLKKVFEIFTSISVLFVLGSCGVSDGPSLFTTNKGSSQNLSAPINVVANGAPNSIVLSWSAVTGASSYNVYCGSSQPVNLSTATKYSNVTSPYTVTGLSGGIPQYCVVTTVSGSSESTSSAQVTASANLIFSNGQAASVVIGQNTFTTSNAATTATGLSYPWGHVAVSDSGILYINDYYSRPRTTPLHLGLGSKV